MKVLLVNGGPHPKGCTNRALEEVEKALKEEGIETLIYHIPNVPLQDCIACGSCAKTGKCVFDDCVNEFASMAKDADGFIFGTPVYYAHPTGKIQSFMDRVFYSAKSAFVHKPAATISSSRRAGSVTSMDVLNKYFSISQMPIVSSMYWNEVHGNTVEEVEQDKEGLDTMYALGKNMAWMLKCIEAGKKAGIDIPQDMAGLMLGAIISDTLLFKSPTCTPTDTKMAKELAKIAGVDIQEFGMSMFKAGTSLVGKTVEEIFNQDYKKFTFGDLSAGVAQVNTMDIEGFAPYKKDMLDYMDQVAKDNHMDFTMLLLTDVINATSEVLVAGPRKDYVETAFHVELVDQQASLPGVISRKKQVVPVITEVLTQ